VAHLLRPRIDCHHPRQKRMSHQGAAARIAGRRASLARGLRT
jgi:hypothetical protein